MVFSHASIKNLGSQIWATTDKTDNEFVFQIFITHLELNGFVSPNNALPEKLLNIAIFIIAVPELAKSENVRDLNKHV